jgi:hypothetical protein
MLISKVDAILSKHPFFANMETSRKIGIYNKIYTKIFYTRSDITVVNRTVYPSDSSYGLSLHIDEDRNLSAHKDVDSLMNEESLLQNLTDEQKIAIFEIAAYKINIFRTLREDQEYYFNTNRADAESRTNIFSPLLAVASKILSPIIETFIYRPLAKATAMILSVTENTNYFIPLLTVSSRIWELASSIYTYRPLISATFRVYDGDAFVETNVYLPLLTVQSLVLSSPFMTVTYSPLLGVEAQVIVNVDYTQTYIYQPLLSAAWSIINAV